MFVNSRSLSDDVEQNDSDIVRGVGIRLKRMVTIPELTMNILLRRKLQGESALAVQLVIFIILTSQLHLEIS